MTKFTCTTARRGDRGEGGPAGTPTAQTRLQRLAQLVGRSQSGEPGCSVSLAAFRLGKGTERVRPEEACCCFGCGAPCQRQHMPTTGTYDNSQVYTYASYEVLSSDADSFQT